MQIAKEDYKCLEKMARFSAKIHNNLEVLNHLAIKENSREIITTNLDVGASFVPTSDFAEFAGQLIPADVLLSAVTGNGEIITGGSRIGAGGLWMEKHPNPESFPELPVFWEQDAPEQVSLPAYIVSLMKKTIQKFVSHPDESTPYVGVYGNIVYATDGKIMAYCEADPVQMNAKIPIGIDPVSLQFLSEKEPATLRYKEESDIFFILQGKLQVVARCKYTGKAIINPRLIIQKEFAHTVRFSTKQAIEALTPIVQKWKPIFTKMHNYNGSYPGSVLISAHSDVLRVEWKYLEAGILMENGFPLAETSPHNDESLFEINPNYLLQAIKSVGTSISMSWNDNRSPILITEREVQILTPQGVSVIMMPIL